MSIEDTPCPGDLPERYLTYNREPGSFTKENFCVCRGARRKTSLRCEETMVVASVWKTLGGVIPLCAL